jgi:Protein of unknown function (DUF2971)
MKHNYLNLKERDLDKPIYRVFSKKRLFEVFEHKKLVLVQPKLWDDPFENYIMNSTGELSDGKLFRVDFRENFYGQCWTLKKESDAIWRIYAPEKDGMKVKTTIRKLLTALHSKGGTFKDISSFIGKVEYYRKEELKKFLEDSKKISSMLTDTSGAGQASTLLFKRIAFSHEKEVRLIYYSREKLKTDKYFLDIDPVDLFDEITVDPRTKYSDFKSWKSQLRNLGYKKKMIRSLLYKTPDLKFKFDR